MKSIMWNVRAQDCLNHHYIQIRHFTDETEPFTFVDVPKAINIAKIILKLKSSS